MIERLPQKFVKVIVGAFREDGRLWLQSLPEIVRQIERAWAISVKDPFPNLSYHFVAPCVVSGGAEAVLKIGFPGETANILREAKMLEFLGGANSVELWRFDADRFAFLLEKLTPGENLKTISRDDESSAARIAARVMRDFWRKPPENVDFPSLEDWFGGFEKAEKTSFSGPHLKRARRYFEELNDAAEKMLLHGDFHHENILSATREPFLAIDPKGVVGGIGYDVAVFMTNQARWLEDEPDRRDKIAAAVETFASAMEIEPRNIRKWTYAQSVLSAWWTFEDNGDDWKSELARAEIWEH